MISSFKTDSREIQMRAAQVRRGWSAQEKIRRIGLPPDVPSRLKQFILGEAPAAWKPALCVGQADTVRSSQSR